VVDVNSGVKTKKIVSNSRAFFTAHGCHNWNLMLGYGTKSQKIATSLFLA
jgi:hypothetical protein